MLPELGPVPGNVAVAVCRHVWLSRIVGHTMARPRGDLEARRISARAFARFSLLRAQNNCRAKSAGAGADRREA